MYAHRLEDLSTKNKAAFNWLLLSFNGGFINTGGFLATGRFVSHVTGFATLFGVDLVKNGWKEAIGILSVPLFFLIGAFSAGMLIDRQIFKSKVPHYDYVMALSASSLIVATFAGFFTKFVAFGIMTDVSESYVVLAALCLACGLQNAALTSSSGSSVRTTHLTGVTTDLGLGLARICSMAKDSPKAKNEMRANRLRAGTIFSFVIGSAVSAIVFYHAQYYGFLIPAAIALFSAWEGRKVKHEAHRLGRVAP